MRTMRACMDRKCASLSPPQVLERVVEQAARGIREYLDGMPPEDLATAEEGAASR